LHRFRIERRAGEVRYYVDGAQAPAATHAIALAGPMRPAASDFAPGGPTLGVGWIRVSPYEAAGSFLSRVHDGGGSVTWQSISWEALLPDGTSLGLFARTGDTPAPDASWTAFAVVPGSGSVLGASGRYLQYRVDLATNDPQRTPELASVTASCATPTDVEPPGVETLPHLTTLGGARPNPFGPATRFAFEVARAGRVRITVYDVGGRRIRDLLDGWRHEGAGTVAWDGRDERGRSVPSGVYLVRLVSADGVRTGRVTRLR
jgi:hypothetical protein